MTQSKKQASQDTTTEEGSDQSSTDQQLLTPIGESDADPVTRTVTKSQEGRRVVTFDRKGPSGNYFYADLEPVGDMDLFPQVQVKPVKDQDGVADVNVDGRWIRATVEDYPLVVTEHVE